MSFVFPISHSRSLSPFFSFVFAGLPPTLSFSLSLSCSIFQIWGHDNQSKLNTLDNTDTETISPFRFRLYYSLVVTRVALRFPAKITSSCIWVVIPVDWVILHWYACGADGRSLARCTVTWLQNFLGWVDLPTHGAPLVRASAPLWRTLLPTIAFVAVMPYIFFTVF